MSRPQKVGLDYFPFDVSFDTKFKLIEAEFGIIGFAILVKLFQKIYGEQGYFCEFNRDVISLFAAENRVDEDTIINVTAAAAERGIFDKKIYEKYGVLTSHGIQVRFMGGTARRQRVDMDKRYFLLCSHETGKNVYIDGVNVCNNGVNADINPQRKEKKSKVNESKVNERREMPAALADASAHGKYKNVLLTKQEFDELEEELGKDSLCKYITEVDLWCESKGTGYANYAAAIRRWAGGGNQKRQRTSPFNNYNDENTTDYEALEEVILASMLDED